MKKLIIILPLLFLSACATDVPQITVVSSIPAIPAPTMPEPVRPKDFNWTVYNKNEIFNLVEILKANPNIPYSLFGLTADGYQNLQLLLVDLLRYIDQQKAVIETYQEFIQKLNELDQKSKEDQNKP